MSFSVNSSADSIYFIDFAKVLNSSKPGAEAQKSIKQKLQSENKKFANLQNNIRKEESDIISQKSTLSPEEYKKKVQALRNKVADLQKNKETSFNNIAKDAISNKPTSSFDILTPSLANISVTGPINDPIPAPKIKTNFIPTFNSFNIELIIVLPSDSFTSDSVWIDSNK